MGKSVVFGLGVFDSLTSHNLVNPLLHWTGSSSLSGPTNIPLVAE